jgi:hypothetical protein
MRICRSGLSTVCMLFAKTIYPGILLSDPYLEDMASLHSNEGGPMVAEIHYEKNIPQMELSN